MLLSPWSLIQFLKKELFRIKSSKGNALSEVLSLPILVQSSLNLIYPGFEGLNLDITLMMVITDEAIRQALNYVVHHACVLKFFVLTLSFYMLYF